MQLDQALTEDVQLRKSTSPAKRAQTATKKKVTKSGNGTSTITKISTQYEARGYTEQLVNLDHLNAMETELTRERGVTESCQSDVGMLREQLSRANDRIGGLEKVREEQASHITSLEKVRDTQSTHITSLEEENGELKQENEGLLDDKDKLQRELQSASTYIQSIETKCFEANRTSLELLEQVKSLEAEVETLKAYIIDLKARIAVYIPVKSDPVDNKLAEYINNYPDRNRLKIMFMRESDGVYEFGQKRVRVKVERGKILIQVGGGNLTIDEFLDQYTPTELQKLERTDPLRRMHERVAVQKIVSGQRGVETSPVRRQASPAKKQKV